MIETDVLYEDNHLLVLNKAAGQLVQGDKTGDEPLVESGKAYLKHKYQKPGAVFLGVVHRLDRPVSGVIVFARTSKALSRMNKLFQSRDVEKTYWAVTDRPPPQPEGTLVNWLRKDEKRNITQAYLQDKHDTKKAELTYRVLKKEGRQYLLEVKPLTGRSHQIRVQLATMGCPIVGDLKYGYGHPHSDQNISLHARRLSFVHPVRREPVTFLSPLPDKPYWLDFANSL